MGKFSKIFKHIESKDLRNKYEQKKVAKIQEEKEKKEFKKYLDSTMETKRYNWREGMTTSDIATLSIERSDDPVASLDASIEASFQPADNFIFAGDTSGQNAFDGTRIRASGSGSGDSGGFNVGGNYLAFDQDGSGSGRHAILAPIDASEVDTITITAIVGDGTNGGSAPNNPEQVGNENLGVFYHHTDMRFHQGIGFLPPTPGNPDDGRPPGFSLDQSLAAGDILPVGGSKGSGLHQYSLAIPEYARSKATQFSLVMINSSGTLDNIGITDIKFERKAPMNVIVSLDDPRASSFIRGAEQGSTPKKRKKAVDDQLAASDQYTKAKFGNEFPGQEVRVGGEDPFKGAEIGDDVEPSPQSKDEVKKSFSKFTNQTDTVSPQTTAQPETEPKSVAPSSQATMTPTTEDGEEIPIKPVGGKNSGAVEGADAATLRDELAKAHAEMMEKQYEAMYKAELEGASPESLSALSVRQYLARKPLEDALEIDSPVPSMPTELEIEEPKPEELKASDEEKEGKTEEEIEEIEKEKYEEEESKQINIIMDKLLDFAKQIDPLDMPIDLALDVAAGIGRLGKGVHQIRSFLKKISGGRFGTGRGLLIDPDIALADSRYQKLFNNIEIMRSNLTGRITTHKYTSNQISDLANTLNVSRFSGTDFYNEQGGSYGISDTRHEYVDDNIYVKDGVVYDNTTEKIQSLANMETGARSIDGIGKGYGQMIIPKDGSKPYFHFYDYNYHNLNSASPDELPPDFITNFGAKTAQVLRSFLPGRIFDDAINRIQGNLNTFGNNLKTRVGLDGWPPGIHGATLTDFKIPLDQLPEKTQKMIAAHPLSWSDERIANMNHDEIMSQIAELTDNYENEYYRKYIEYTRDPKQVPPEFVEAMKKVDGHMDNWIETDTRFQEAEKKLEELKSNLNIGKGKDSYMYVKNNKAGEAGRKEYNRVVKILHDYYDDQKAQGYKNYDQKYVDRISKQIDSIMKRANKSLGSKIDGNGNIISDPNATYDDFVYDDGRVVKGLGGELKDAQKEVDDIQLEFDELDELMMREFDSVEDLLKPIDGKFVQIVKGEEFKKNYDYMSPESWTPDKKGSGIKRTRKTKPKSSSTHRSSFAGLSSDDSSFVSTFPQSKTKKKKKNTNESYLLTVKKHQFIIDHRNFMEKKFFNSKDIKPIFPENPPPKLDPKTGMHPQYGKKANRFKKLDPISANSMPPTGDPEIDAVVNKQKTVNKIKKMARNK